MANAIEVKVPDIGDFKNIPVIEVMVKPGDTIKAEDSLVTLESDKSTMDVPSPAAGVVKGRTVSSYPAVGPGVTLGGGTAADIPVDQAVTDGTLVSAPAWPAHPAWIAQFLEVLGTRIVHE